MPHNKISRGELLQEIKRLADKLGETPSKKDIRNDGKYSNRPYYTRFVSRAVAQTEAGCMPPKWHPLTSQQIHQFHQAARATQQPEEKLPALFFQFLPVTRDVYLDFDSDWLSTLADDLILNVPKEYAAGSAYRIKIPEMWQNPVTDKRVNTRLPAYLNWYFSNNESPPHSTYSPIHGSLARVADKAGLKDRPIVVFEDQELPRVSPGDLMHSHGIHLARNGASNGWISRRMNLGDPDKAQAYHNIVENINGF